MIIVGYIVTYSYIFALLFITQILQKKKIIQPETGRKIVHIFVSLSWFIMVFFFKTSIHLMIPPFTFIFLNILAYRNNLFAIERTDLKGFGTIYYPISMTLLAILTILDHNFLVPYGIGLFSMAFADGLASCFGKHISSPMLGNSSKTVAGSLSVMIITGLVILGMSFLFSDPFSLFKWAVASISAMLLEAIGLRGTDNLTLPLGVALLYYVL